MKLDKTIILFIFLVFLVGVSFVSAENIDDTSDLSTVDADDAISFADVSDLSTVDADDAISADGPEDNVAIDESDVLSNSRSSITVYNWTSLGSEVYNNNYDTINIGANLTPGGQISIRHSVTIVGSADTYIGGSSPSTSVSYSDIPIVTSANGLSVTFKNIRFQNCGGNTFMKLAGNGNFILDNCTFENISASGTKTVVVHLNYGTCDIINCTFDNCLSDYGTVSNYKTDQEPEKVHMIVRDTTFKNNYATTEPGGINNCGFLTVYNSTFVNNSAAWWAGAIHTHYNGTTNIYGSNFIDNVAGMNGGALYTYNYLKVVNSNFTNNEAHNKDGGAIAASRYPMGGYPTVIIENCKFDNNSAVRYGGAISSANGILNVTNSDFINNYAPTNGGAIYSNKCTANVISCFFRNNTAPNGKGGAVFGTGKGRLNVDYCIFVNNSALDDNSGHALAYSYTGSSATAAYLTYTNNEFYGPNNGTGSVYAANNKLNIVQYNNTISDYSNYTEPDDNSSGSVVPIPSGTPIGHQEWNASLSGALGGTPLVIGDRIYVPNGHSIYCLNVTNGALLWNVSSNYVDEPEWNNFHDLALHNGVLIAPSDMDKLYFFDAITGSQIQPNSTIIQGSSLYAPLVVGDKIYISSEYPYGVGGNKWIAVVEYANGTYNYTNSILEINNAFTALISAPILWNNYLWVNTINGLVRYDLTTNTYITPVSNAVGKPVVGGDYIYVLTADNHICGVNANGNVIKNITVSDSIGVGSTLAINNANDTLYTVDANGNIYRAAITSNNADLLVGQNVNPVSSALVVGNDGNLYIGDDEGIFWVVKVFQYYGWKNQVLWAYNSSSAIYGTPLLNGNIVYIGNENTYYALSSGSNFRFSLNSNNKKLIASKQELLMSYSENNALKTVLDPTNPLTENDFATSDTIYYFNNGTYTLTGMYGFSIGADPASGMGINNIVLKPNGDANVTIKITNEFVFMIVIGNNITVENIKFTGSYHSQSLLQITGATNVTLRNCTFEDMESGPSVLSIDTNSYVPGPVDCVLIENCKFINVKSTSGNTFSITQNVKSVNFKNCIFKNCTTLSNRPLLNIGSGSISLESNTFDTNNSITVDGGEIVSDVSFNVLTESLTVGESGSIVGELVDDNGNPINSPKLKFLVNDVEQTPTFDKTTGQYTFKITPSDASDIKVSAVCSNVEPFDVESIYIKVSKPSSNLTLGDDITFDYGQSGSTTVSYEGATSVVAEVVNCTATIKIENGNITVSGLDAGNYTLKVTTVADDDHANVTKTVNITVKKVDCDINIMNPVIYVYGNIGQCSVFSEGVIDFTASIVNHTEAIINIDSNGIVNVSGLNVGKYVLEVTANPDKNHKSITRQTNVTVSEAESHITIPNIVFTYGESGSVNATLVGATGITNASVLNHTEAVVKIVNNTITVSGLNAGSYVLQATTIPDANHNPVTATANITVNGVEVPADKAISTNVPANTKSPTFSIKLDKDATGTFTVNIDNGKIVKTAELKDGAASITVADLATGDHTISVSYSGDGKYAPITQNTTLNIKEPVKPVTKKATKIVAKKKTFKAKKKTKKYTITLKAGKKLISKVKVTIKVGKKTYTAKTNKKGKATFNLKKLTKKGKYTAVIKFKGNKNYKATSKKVKITVKK